MGSLKGCVVCGEESWAPARRGLKGGAQGVVLDEVAPWSSRDRVSALPYDLCKFRYTMPTLQDTGKMPRPSLPSQSSQQGPQGVSAVTKGVRKVSWKLGSQWRPKEEWRWVGKGRRGPNHTWDVGQGEKGRSSPALCLLGPDPSSGALRVFFHCGCGSPTSTWARASLPAPGPPLLPWPPCWSCFPLPNPSTGQGLCPESVNKYDVWYIPQGAGPLSQWRPQSAPGTVEGHPSARNKRLIWSCPVLRDLRSSLAKRSWAQTWWRHAPKLSGLHAAAHLCGLPLGLGQQKKWSCEARLSAGLSCLLAARAALRRWNPTPSPAWPMKLSSMPLPDLRQGNSEQWCEVRS